MMKLERVNVVLLVILILLTAVGLSTPILRRLQLTAHRTQTTSNLKNMALAIHGWHDSYKRLPPAFDRSPATTHQSDPTIDYPVSVHVHLMPYLDQQAIFATYLTEGKGNARATVPGFLSPMDGTLEDPAGVQNFAANLRLFSDKGGGTESAKDMPALARVEPGHRTLVGITRGSSNTMAFATKLARCGNGGSQYAADPTSSYAPFFGQTAARTTAHFSNPQSTFQWAPRGDECRCVPLMAQSYLPQPLLVGMADATVRAIPGEINPSRWNAFLDPVGR